MIKNVTSPGVHRRFQFLPRNAKNSLVCLPHEDAERVRTTIDTIDDEQEPLTIRKMARRVEICLNFLIQPQYLCKLPALR